MKNVPEFEDFTLQDDDIIIVVPPLKTEGSKIHILEETKRRQREEQKQSKDLNFPVIVAKVGKNVGKVIRAHGTNLEETTLFTLKRGDYIFVKQGAFDEIVLDQEKGFMNPVFIASYSYLTTVIGKTKEAFEKQYNETVDKILEKEKGNLN